MVGRTQETADERGRRATRTRPAAAGRALLAGLAAATAVLGSAAGAGAATGDWQGPQLLARTGPGIGLSTCEHVVIDGAGKATAVRLVEDRLVASSRRPGGFWTAPRTIAADAAGPCEAAVDPSGTITVVWSDDQGVHAVRGRGAGSFGAPERVAPAVAESTTADLAVFDSGAIVTYAAPGADPYSGLVRVVERTAAGWSTPTTLVDTEGDPAITVSPRVHVGANARGEAAVVWDKPTAEGSSYPQTATRDVGGRWAGAGFAAAAGPIAVSPSGVATIVTAGHILDRAPGGSSSAAQPAAPGSGGAEAVIATRAAYDGGGTLIVAFETYRLGPPDFEGRLATFTARRPVGGTFGPTVPIGAGGGGQLAVDAAGNTAISYVGPEATDSGDPKQAYVRVRPAGGDWGPATPLRGPSLAYGDARVAIAVGPGAAAAAIHDRVDGDFGGAFLSARDGSGTAPDATAPVLTSGAFDPYVFASDAATTLRVAVSEPSLVRATVESYDLTRGFVSYRDQLDAEPFVVRGRLGTLRLPGTGLGFERLGFEPGVYRVTLTAADAAGNTSAPLVTFAYVPR